MSRQNNITDADLFDVPDLPDDDIEEADRVTDGIPLDAEEVAPEGREA